MTSRGWEVYNSTSPMILFCVSAVRQFLSRSSPQPLLAMIFHPCPGSSGMPLDPYYRSATLFCQPFVDPKPGSSSIPDPASSLGPRLHPHEQPATLPNLKMILLISFYDIDSFRRQALHQLVLKSNRTTCSFKRSCDTGLPLTRFVLNAGWLPISVNSAASTVALICIPK